MAPKPPLINSDLVAEAKRLNILSHKEPKDALTKITKLCDENVEHLSLHVTRLEILCKLYTEAEDTSVKKEYMLDAIKTAEKTIQLSPDSLLAWHHLTSALFGVSTTVFGYIKTILLCNTALKIETPNDPLSDACGMTTVEILKLKIASYEQRIGDTRNAMRDLIRQSVDKVKQLGADFSTIKNHLQTLKLQTEVQLYWSSLSLEVKKDFFQVKVVELSTHLSTSRMVLEEELLLEALSFFEAHQKWDFSTCCCCDCANQFTTESLFPHIAQVHMEKLVLQLQEFVPATFGEWTSMINGITWKPLDKSRLEKDFNTKTKRGKGRFPSYGLRKAKVTPWSNRYTFEKVSELPTISDSASSERAHLLKKLQEILQKRMSQSFLMPTHVALLIQEAIRKLGEPIATWLRLLNLDETHYSLCLLEASDLTEIIEYFQTMSIHTMKISSELITTRKEKPVFFENEGVIFLSDDCLNLHLDKDLISRESGDSYEGGLVSWLYSDPSSDVDFMKWRDSRDERRRRGKAELLRYIEKLEKGLKEVEELQNPNADASTQTTFPRKSSELSEVDKCILQLAVDFHLLDEKVKSFAHCDYRPFLLSTLKSYIRGSLEANMGNNHQEESCSEEMEIFFTT